METNSISSEKGGERDTPIEGGTAGVTRAPNQSPRTEFMAVIRRRHEMGSQTTQFAPKRHHDYYSAGVLPFCIHEGRILFLLGRDNEGTWSDFGGHSEIHDQGRWNITAAREFYEETIGSVLTIEQILERLESKKNYVCIYDRTLGNYNYYMYLLRIPYSAVYRGQFLSTHSFMRYLSGKISKEESRHYLEKNDIGWFTAEEWEDLRPIFRRTFEGNRHRILSFCESFLEQPKVVVSPPSAPSPPPIPKNE